MVRKNQQKAGGKSSRAVKDLKPRNEAGVKGGHIAVSDSGVANPKPIVVPIKK